MLGVGLRLVGVYGLIQSIGFLVEISQFVAIYWSGEYTQRLSGWYLLQAGALLLMVFASLALVKFPATVARWLLPATRESGTSLSQSAEDLQAIGLTLLGCFLLSYAIPDFVSSLYLWHTAASVSGPVTITDEEVHVANLLNGVIELGLGLLLILRARGLSQLFTRLRYGAT